jgi:hypothetical protein
MLSNAREEAGIVGMAVSSQTSRAVAGSGADSKDRDKSGRLKRTVTPVKIEGIPSVSMNHTCEVLGRTYKDDRQGLADKSWLVFCSLVGRLQPLLGQTGSDGKPLFKVSHSPIDSIRSTAD